MRVLILEHTPLNPAGVYRQVVEERGGTPTVVNLDQGDPLPDLTSFDAVIAMGGDMGVNDADRIPWLEDEIRMIRRAVSAGLPYFGVCLGGQMLAASLGARVDRLPTAEVGFPRIELSKSADSDPVFQRLPRPFHAFVWHDDAFDLPEGAVLLGGTPEAHQAFRWGERAYGVQFHLEATAGMVRGWLDPRSQERLERRLGPGAGERMLEELRRREGEQRTSARILVQAWLDEVVGTPAGRLPAQSGPPGVKGEEGA